MAIINCPACGKRISSVAKSCEFCNVDFTGDDDHEKMLRIAKNKRIDRIQQYQNFSFLFVVLFAAGSLLMYMGISDQDETLNYSGTVMLVLGFIGYITTRVLLFINRRK